MSLVTHPPSTQVYTIGRPSRSTWSQSGWVRAMLGTVVGAQVTGSTASRAITSRPLR
jgi:hypothetical protein